MYVYMLCTVLREKTTLQSIMKTEKLFTQFLKKSTEQFTNSKQRINLLIIFFNTETISVAAIIKLRLKLYTFFFIINKSNIIIIIIFQCSKI